MRLFSPSSSAVKALVPLYEQIERRSSLLRPFCVQRCLLIITASSLFDFLARIRSTVNTCHKKRFPTPPVPSKFLPPGRRGRDQCSETGEKEQKLQQRITRRSDFTTEKTIAIFSNTKLCFSRDAHRRSLEYVFSEKESTTPKEWFVGRAEILVRKLEEASPSPWQGDVGNLSSSPTLMPRSFGSRFRGRTNTETLGHCGILYGRILSCSL